MKIPKYIKTKKLKFKNNQLVMPVCVKWWGWPIIYLNNVRPSHWYYWPHLIVIMFRVWIRCARKARQCN